MDFDEMDLLTEDIEKLLIGNLLDGQDDLFLSDEEREDDEKEKENCQKIWGNKNHSNREFPQREQREFSSRHPNNYHWERRYTNYTPRRQFWPNRQQSFERTVYYNRNYLPNNGRVFFKSKCRYFSQSFDESPAKCENDTEKLPANFFPKRANSYTKNVVEQSQHLNKMEKEQHSQSQEQKSKINNVDKKSDKPAVPIGYCPVVKKKSMENLEKPKAKKNVENTKITTNVVVNVNQFQLPSKSGKRVRTISFSKMAKILEKHEQLEGNQKFENGRFQVLSRIGGFSESNQVHGPKECVKNSRPRKGRANSLFVPNVQPGHSTGRNGHRGNGNGGDVKKSENTHHLAIFGNLLTHLWTIIQQTGKYVVNKIWLKIYKH